MSSITIETFGQQMRHLRLNIHMSAKELSNITGIDPTIISRYENDRRVPGFGNMQKIMVALGANSTDFEGFEMGCNRVKA